MKYWAYVNNEILGPFEKDKLRELPSFSPSMLVCPQTPVGEKTEDWKEASTYPELSAGGAAQAAPAPEPAPQPAFQPEPVSAPEPARQSFPQPAIETTSLSFKPLRAAQSIDPVPPPTHTDGMADIAVNRLGGGAAAAAPAPEPVAQASSGFDPISLSQIVRRTENIEPETPAQGLALEPRNDQFQPSPAQAFEPDPAPAAEPAPAPEPAAYTPPAAAAPAQFEPENFPRAAAPAAAAPVVDTAGLEKLLRRLDEISANSVSRKDVDNAVDPIRIKLDQMGEVVSSIKNSQFQREVTDKLAYLESAIGDVKAALRNPAPAAAPAPAHELKIERNSDTVFGVEPQRAAREPEKAKAEPAKEPVKEEPKDIGTKKSNIGMALKKVFKLILTLALLAAVLLGTVIGLKTFGIFDATMFIPFPLPFVSAPQQPAQAEAGALPGGQGAAPEQAGQPAGESAQAAPAAQPVPAAETKSPEQAVQDAAPEVTYIARTFKTASGASLENRVYDHATKAGGNPNNTAWEVRAAPEGKFEIDAVIPSRTGKLTYTFLVDRAQKTVSPINDAAMAALAAAPPARKSAAKKAPAKRPAVQKTAPKPAPKPAPAAEGTEEEYEYVYEDEIE
ncbi:MAG: hypothetical protein AB7V08_04735 [Elusimicrobiales bacterium]